MSPRDATAITIDFLGLIAAYGVIAIPALFSSKKNTGSTSIVRRFSMSQAFAIGAIPAIAFVCWIFVLVWRSCSSSIHAQTGTLQWGLIAAGLYAIYWVPLWVIAGSCAGFLNIPVHSPKLYWVLLLLIFIMVAATVGWNMSTPGIPPAQCVL